MKTTKTLKLLTPEVKTMFLGTHASQKASYLLLPEDYQENLLEADVENGASFYAPCLETSGQLSNFSIITARTLEDGYRAVVYLASQRAVQNLHAEAPEEFTAPEEEDLFLSSEPVSISYTEHFSRIPIIPLGEIEHYNDSSNFFGFDGPFQMQMYRSNNQTAPWWLDCSEESVCIVQDLDHTPFQFMDESSSLAFTQEAISSLNRFLDNDHVYILVIGKNIAAQDISINQAMLEYTASCCNLLHPVSDCTSYHLRLLQDLVKRYQFTLSKDIDSTLLSEKLESVNPSYPCATYEKAMKYLLQSGAKSPVSPDAFRFMGLHTLINKRTNSGQKNALGGQLFGMDSVKKSLENIINALRYNKMREENQLAPLDFHKTFLFIGAPGTAKTTMAQLLADQMAKEGFLPGNRFISVNGAQLKAQYLGQTTSLVHSLFEDYDAILIDEAYSLTSSNHGELDSYGQEAMAQLAVELEKHSKDKLVIFAGYGGKKVSRANNKMLQFIEANPGIKSRINTTIYFDSYTPDTMTNILHHLASLAGLTVSKDCDPLIQDYFRIRSQAEDFGNGREARSLLEQCQVSLANRLIAMKDSVKKAEISRITRDDVALTIQSLTEMNDQQQGIGSRFGYL